MGELQGDLSDRGENQWQELKEVPFNGDNAENMNEGNQEQNKTNLDSEVKSNRFNALQVLDEQEDKEVFRPVGEMESSEIVREYLDTLQDLSSNFTSPEGKASAVVNENGEIRDRRGYSGDQKFIEGIYAQGGLELDKSNNGATFNAVQYVNPDLDRAHTLKMVDKILDNEQAWRDVGEDYQGLQDNLNVAVQQLNDLQTEHQGKGGIDRIKSFFSYRNKMKELQKVIEEIKTGLERTEYQTGLINKKLGESLNSTYSPDYHYGSHRFSSEHAHDENYINEVNEEYNGLFFGEDNPERQAKVERALELRKAIRKG